MTTTSDVLAMMEEKQGYGKALNYLVNQKKSFVLDAFYAFVNERRVICGFQPTTDLNVNSWASYIFEYSLRVANAAKNAASMTDHDLRRQVKNDTKRITYDAEMDRLFSALQRCIIEYY